MHPPSGEEPCIPKSKIQNLKSKMAHQPPPTLLTPQFETALTLAYRLHAQQRRKDQTPYIAHLLSVTALVLENQGTEAEAIAALLHDAIEDQGGAPTRDRIQAEFGDEITAIIDGCTESDAHPKPPWPERRQTYLQQIKAASPSVRLVALADKLHNARSLLQQLQQQALQRDLQQQGQSIWTQFSGGQDGTLWFYQAFLDLYAEPAPPSFQPMLQELHQIVHQLKTLA
jgi:(p)ppGpp synthase/HD superfamily hydrolase